MLKIINGSGFQVTFENGYTIDVKFGWGHQCENYSKFPREPNISPEIMEKLNHTIGENGSKDAEISIISPSGWRHEAPYIPKGIKGYCSPEEVLMWMHYCAALPYEETKKCKWSKCENSDETIYYETSCENAAQFLENGIEDNGYKFCPFCGKEIEEVKE